MKKGDAIALNRPYQDDRNKSVVDSDGTGHAAIEKLSNIWNQPEAAEVLEGRFTMQELCFEGVSRPIPPGESAIHCLVKGPTGRIYGGTGGRNAHLFFYDPLPVNDHVVDIGVVQPDAAVTAIAFQNEFLVGATESGKGEHMLFIYNTEKDQSNYAAYWLGQCEVLEIVKSPVVALKVMSEFIVGLTLDGHFIEIDSLKKRVANAGRVAGARVRRTLVKCENKLFGVADGRIFSFDPGAGGIRETGVCLPADGNRSRGLSSAAVKGNVIYGGVREDGMLFRFEPDSGILSIIGKPCRESNIRCMAFAGNGLLYGLAGEDNGFMHLFSFNPEDGAMRELGIPFVRRPRAWHMHMASSMLTGHSGELLIGEKDRVSHLWTYWPSLVS